VFVTEVLGGGGGRSCWSSRCPASPRYEACPDPVCLSVEVLKLRSRLSVCRGLETQIPSVRLSRSWNSDPVCPSVEVLKLRSRLSVCRGLEIEIPNSKSKITAQKPAWFLFSDFLWKPVVLWGFFEITRTGSGSLILNFFSNTQNLWFFDSEF
jgi:hypothetical protein